MAEWQATWQEERGCCNCYEAGLCGGTCALGCSILATRLLCLRAQCERAAVFARLLTLQGYYKAQGLHARVTGHATTANEAHGSKQHLPLVLYEFLYRHAFPLTRAVQATTMAECCAPCEQ